MPEPMDVQLPAALRDAIRGDLTRVRPLLPPPLRAVFVALAVLIAILIPLQILGVRRDLVDVPALAFWLPFVLRICVGLALTLVALRESVPSEGVARSVWTALLVFAVVLMFILPVAFATVMKASDGPLNAEDVFCYQVQSMIAAPAFLLSLYLVRRGFPLRPLLAMLAAGFGVGFLADAALFAVCNIHSQKHWLLAHSGAVLTCALAGAAAGGLLGFLRRRPLAE